MTTADDPASCSKDEGIISLLRSIYAMEVYGEAAFALMLEHGGRLSFEQRRKIEACRLLTVEMAELIHHHFVLHLGLPLSAPSTLTFGPGLHTAIHEESWQARMIGLELATTPAVAHFRELKSQYAARAPKLCNTLLAHALMVRDFAHREAEGEPEHSLGGVVSLLGAEGREALLLFQS